MRVATAKNNINALKSEAASLGWDDGVLLFERAECALSKNGVLAGRDRDIRMARNMLVVAAETVVSACQHLAQSESEWYAQRAHLDGLPAYEETTRYVDGLREFADNEAYADERDMLHAQISGVKDHVAALAEAPAFLADADQKFFQAQENARRHINQILAYIEALLADPQEPLSITVPDNRAT